MLIAPSMLEQQRLLAMLFSLARTIQNMLTSHSREVGPFHVIFSCLQGGDTSYYFFITRN